jgi:hypothetical protein
VSGTDANSGAAVGPVSASTASVLGQAPAALAATTFSASPTTVNTGQAATVTLTLSNTGGASAIVSALAPKITPVANASCGAVSPTLPQTIAGGANTTFTWTCSATSASSYNLNATITATDANSGTSVAPSLTNVPLTVQLPAALSAALSGPGAPVDPGATFDVTMAVTDTGDATANSVVPTISVSFSTGHATLQAGPTPASATVASGTPATFTWTYLNDGGASGTATFDGSVTGTDATSGASIGPVLATGTTVDLNSSGPLGMAEASSALTADGPGTMVASDPLGDGTAQALLAIWQGGVWVGPGRDGTRLARIDPAGSGTVSYDLAFAVDRGATPAGNPAWATGPTASTLGSPGCLAGTTFCGPDGEAGAVLLAAGALGGADRLWLAGTGPAGSRYLYAAAAVASPLDLAFVDLRDPIQAAGASGWAPLLTGMLADPAAARLYLAYAGRGAGSGPILLALGTPPASPGLDAAAGLDVLDLQAAAMPGIAGSGLGPGITALASLGGVVYVGHEDGIVRATAAAPGPGDWALATPAAAAWTGKAPVPLPASGPAALRDRSVPALAAFGTCATGPCVFAARNVQGDASQPAAVPQLWRCDPAAGPAQCAPGDWRLAAANASGDQLLTQLGDATNGAATVLAATPRWLYLGFDNGSTGVQLYRAAVAPAAAGDFQGEAGCRPGTLGCQGLGGNGFGDPTVTRIFDFRVFTVDGVTSLWITAGDGSGPVRVYRIPD